MERGKGLEAFSSRQTGRNGDRQQGLRDLERENHMKKMGRTLATRETETDSLPQPEPTSTIDTEQGDQPRTETCEIQTTKQSSWGGTSAERSWHEILFSKSEFAHENCSEILPDFLEPLFCGPKQIPQNSRQMSHKIPLQKIKKHSPTSFCRHAGKNSSDNLKVDKQRKMGKIFEDSNCLK